MTSGQLLPEDLAERARRTAELMAHRLADEERVSEAVRRWSEADAYLYQWGGASLYSGHAGIAMVLRYAARAMPDSADRWRTLSREFLLRAVRHTREQAVAHVSLGTGSAGLALVISEFARDESGYQRSLDDLHGKLCEQVSTARDWYREDGVDFGAYDVVSGAAGVLGHVAGVPDPGPGVRAAATTLIDGLVRMCTPVEDPGPPPWHVPVRHYYRALDVENYPHGYTDLGFAHGLSGILSALSLAWGAGYQSSATREVMMRIATFLLESSRKDEWGRYWPQQLPVSAAGEPPLAAADGPDGRPGPRRMSWCYGSPGICAGLLEAANALSDQELRSAATEGFETALQRVADGAGQIDTASLCHGWAGLLMICQKFAEESGSAAARKALPDLTERVLSQCDPENLLVVRERRDQNTLVDSPDLLDGAGGVPLALWSVAAPIDTRWQRALLIR
jgi:lantibiotic modifying enzyme